MRVVGRRNMVLEGGEHRSSAVWEERWHPLREEWVIVAAHRQNRPWSGRNRPFGAAGIPSYVADCYLCPGQRSRQRQGQRRIRRHLRVRQRPPVRWGRRSRAFAAGGRYRNRPATARRASSAIRRSTISRSPSSRRQKSRRFSVRGRRSIAELGARPGVEHVLVFENKGEVVGVSNPHPHCQIYATNFVFKTIETEVAASADISEKNGRALLADIIDAELATDGACSRISARRSRSCPTSLGTPMRPTSAPERTVPSLSSLSDAELVDFAATLKQVLTITTISGRCRSRTS